MSDPAARAWQSVGPGASDRVAPARAVVFAYHNVGVRCLSVLLAAGVDVPLVVTHEDSPGETIWFQSVARLAASHGIAVVTPAAADALELEARIAALRPDFLFSFYYRAMLPERLLALPVRGALNMHGSLLPRYRGRAPVNRAVIRGERETGASLHYMTAKPDQGDVVGRQRVPILPDDTAHEVFQKVTWAAEILFERVLPGLIDGSAPREVQDLAAGNYCGGRTPADGRIDWTQSFQDIHNLVRGVAPPYPGATSTLGGLPARILGTRLEANPDPAAQPAQPLLCCDAAGGLRVIGPEPWLLRIVELELEGERCDAAGLAARLGDRVPLITL